jgi:hypothetical protein
MPQLAVVAAVDFEVGAVLIGGDLGGCGGLALSVKG